MRKMLQGIVWVSILFLFSAIQCNTLLSEGGSSSETVIGKVVNPDGSPACSTVVTLYPADYDPIRDAALMPHSSDTTDATGSYSVEAFNSTHFCSLVATRLKSGTRTIVSGITINSNTIHVNDAVLSMPGNIVATAPDSADVENGYLYIPGTGIAVPLNGGRKALINNVPAGMITSVNYRSKKSPMATSVLATAIKVVSNDTTFITYPQWRYSRRFYLNTTASGAGVSGNVVNFPVLIRLDNTNFTFSQALTNGKDIRFTKENNYPLAYEIEQWDTSAGLAAIWVKVDTVYGNDSAHYITMFWGNSLGANQSNGIAVFDTNSGFQGVWHLGETDSFASDATGNSYNGTGHFTISTAGMIGNGQHFNGVSSYIQMKGTAPQSRLNFPMSGHYTISAWVYHDTLADSMTYLIAGKGELQYFIKSFDLALSTPQHGHQWEFSEFHENNIWHAAAISPIPVKTWSYLVGIRDGSNQYLYVNGVMVMNGYKLFGTGKTETPRDTTDDFSIGAFLHPVSDWNQGYAYFNGNIDEVNVSSVPRSADWIKLCYMNQKRPDALVK